MSWLSTVYVRKNIFFLHSCMCDLKNTASTFISTTNENSQVFEFFFWAREH